MFKVGNFRFLGKDLKSYQADESSNYTGSWYITLGMAGGKTKKITFKTEKEYNDALAALDKKFLTINED